MAPLNERRATIEIAGDKIVLRLFDGRLFGLDLNNPLVQRWGKSPEGAADFLAGILARAEYDMLVLSGLLQYIKPKI